LDKSLTKWVKVIRHIECREDEDTWRLAEEAAEKGMKAVQQLAVEEQVGTSKSIIS
jgi:hypothetical protein